MLEIFLGEENEHTVLIDSPGQQGSPVGSSKLPAYPSSHKDS